MAALTRMTCMPGKPYAYDVVVGDGALQQLAEDLAAWRGLPKSSTIVLVTDANVWRWHGRATLAAFAAAGVTPAPLVKVLPPGEPSKTRATKEAIEDWMLANKCFRDTLLIALGGGVIGDMAGYVASTYMRGIPVVQVPTTMLAMVDSSIGGKTGVDTPAGKNLIGAFHQPARVYADTALLATLPRREFVNGLGEVVKAGAIRDPTLWGLCEERPEELVGAPGTARAVVAGGTGAADWAEALALLPPGASNADAEAALARYTADGSGAPPPRVVDVPVRVLVPALVGEVVSRAIAVKVAVVSADEREGGERAILNFGHTIGHGLEAQLQPEVLHGECVSMGMVKEAEVARALGRADSALVGRLKRCFKALGLPVAPPAHLTAGAGLEAVMRAMSVDKKNTKAAASSAAAATADPDAGVVFKCVLLTGIGTVAAPPYAHAVPGRLLRRVLSAAVTVTPPPAADAAALRAGPPVRLRAPGSKSVSNRALLLAGLARGTTRLTGLLSSDDTQVMIAALQTLGARVAWDAATGDALVTGTGGAFPGLPAPSPSGAPTRIYIGNAGTASRFLASVLCLLPALAPGRAVVLEGNARMAVRPIGPLVDALRQQGAAIAYTGKDGCPPLLVTGGIAGGVDSLSAPGGAAATAGARPSPVTFGPTGDPLPALSTAHRLIFLEGAVSSQYVSSVLMAAPLMPPFTRDGGSGDDGWVELVLAEERPTSLPYITMTLATMADFGVAVTRLADNRYLVPRVPYAAPRGRAAGSATPAAPVAGGSGVYEVEADASSASYAAAIAAVTGRTVVLEGVGSGSTQGDAGFPLLLARMGCEVTQDERSTTITGPARVSDAVSGLVGIDVDMANQTDCFMTLAAVAAVATRPTRITGIANQRVKECNRIAAMVAEFAKLGVTARELPDGLEIEGCGSAAGVHGGTVHCYDDHRIAMSFGVLATVVGGVVMDDAGCTEKTYPEFWDVLAASFGYDVRAADAGAAAHASSSGPTPPLPPSTLARSLVVIGMRGAGKSTLAAGAAAWLGAGLHWRAVDLDRALEAQATADATLNPGGAKAVVTVADVVAAEGWEGFRAREAAILRDALAPGAPTARGCVIACGGGVVETESARAALRQWVADGGHVVEVRRDIGDIDADLAAKAAAAAAAAGGSGDTQRPAYAAGASLVETYARRRPLYDACASAVYAVAGGDRDWAAVQAGFNALAERLVTATRSGALLPPPPPASASTAAVDVDAVPASYRGVPVVRRRLPLPATAWPAPSALAAGAASLNGESTAFVCVSVPDVRLLSATYRARQAAAAAAAQEPFDFSRPHGAVWDELGDALFECACGVDAVELRVDLLATGGGSAVTADWRHAEAVYLYQLGLLRQGLRHGAARRVRAGDAGGSAAGAAAAAAFDDLFPLPPVVWTVRSAAEGGAFTGTADEYARAVSLGVRAGAEAVDVEAGSGRWPGAALQQIADAAARAGAAVIGSCHWPGSTPQPDEGELAEALARCRLGGAAAVVKVVGAPGTPADALAFQAAAQRLHAAAAPSGDAPPLIAIAMGAAGVLTRVTNSVLTPVTHPAFPTPAAPGQLDIRGLRALRAQLGLAHPRRYALTGTPIAASLSPAMHNAAFALCGVGGASAYGLLEADTPAPLQAAVRGGDGAAAAVTGANVTIPLKQDVIAPSLLDELSPEAAAIGAVNTVVVTAGGAPGGGAAARVARGDNTDWLGMLLPLRAALARRAAAATGAAAPAVGGGPSPPATALIVGAGGTAMAAAYTARRLGLVPVFVNRTPAKAAALAERFGGAALDALPATASGEAGATAAHRLLAGLAVVINTLPASVGWTPPGWLLPATRPVVFDVAYLPPRAPLLAAADAAGCATVDGRAMIVVQAAAGNGIWQGKAAPLLRAAAGEGAAFGGPAAAAIDLTVAAAMAGVAVGAAARAAAAK